MLNLNTVSKKWQKKWEERKVFNVKENSKKKKFYLLEMFPYPSGSGLHMGHAFNYNIGDIYARFKRMNGYNVLYPMGYDSLGLPAENAAIKDGTHPKAYTEKAIKNYINQQKRLGFSYDWTRVVKTSDPNFYKWDQWIFLKMFEKGIAYRKKAPVNWCSKCNSVLANEQVHNGRCWRHKDNEVEIKNLEQWFFRITDYADELYEGIDKLTGWGNDVKLMQKNWIGKSHGTEINFKINGKDWKVFTTRPDTIYGVTFVVVSAQHPKLSELVTKEHRSEVEAFTRKIKSTMQEDMDKIEKEGVFTGSYALNPLTNEQIPVYAGNFVVADYGSGMVMAVPAHDHRDFEFAKKYNIPIKVVIQPKDKQVDISQMQKAYVDEGTLVNSSQFNGLESTKAIEEISKHIEKLKLGKRTIQYRLKDWLISRQRYWGTPIPIVYCDKCGIAPLSEKSLPVKLPDKVKFGEGNPLETNDKFINIKCPKCGSKARRETDTMDTFVNSSWYFFRYCDPKNKTKIFDKKKSDYWMPIDQYIGGKEHACMHLIYFRFYTKFLRDIGFTKLNEPTLNMFNQGMIHGSDGAVMSKSRGNVVDPLEIIEKLGPDALRLYLVSTASPDKDFIWSDTAIEGSSKFINRVVTLYSKVKIGKSSERTESKINKAIKEITLDINEFKYNLAIIKIRTLFDSFEDKMSKNDLGAFLKLLHPFCPHITEELWEKLGNKKFLSLESWSKVDEKKIKPEIEFEDELIPQVTTDIENIMNMVKITPKQITLSVAEQWKYDIFKKVKKEMGKTRDVGAIIRAVMGQKNSAEISRIVPMLVKNPGKMPEVILSHEQEYKILSNNKEKISKKFNLPVVIQRGNQKATPGKPAIFLE